MSAAQFKPGPRDWLCYGTSLSSMIRWKSRATQLEQALEDLRADLTALQPALNVMAREVLGDVIEKHIDTAIGKPCSASVDTLPKGRDAKQGSVRSKGSAVPKADAQDPSQGPSA